MSVDFYQLEFRPRRRCPPVLGYRGECFLLRLPCRRNGDCPIVSRVGFRNYESFVGGGLSIGQSFLGRSYGIMKCRFCGGDRRYLDCCSSGVVILLSLRVSVQAPRVDLLKLRLADMPKVC